MAKVIGIDLGTTYSAIATINEHGKPEILANREGERITPSVVLFDGDAPIVGSIAKRSAVASPSNVVQFVKRQMGNPSWKFLTEQGQVWRAEEISAIILKRLKEDAETLLGETVRDAVVTVPAYFNDAQRKATQDAGRIAGLNILRLINEPTAAALAYGFDKVKQDQIILIYDLGGGTFDVTIMRLGGGRIEVLSTGGHKNLGGFDWDNEVMKFLNSEFKKQGGCDLLEDQTLQQDLRDKAEIAKRTLSSRDKATVFLSARGKNASIPLSLATFESLTDTLLKRTARIMGEVLEDAHLQWKDIDKVLLVGGSTRMKAVPALIERASGRKPSMEVNPDEVVAVGAAIQAMMLQVEAGTAALVERETFPIVEIQDVNAHSLGVLALDDFGAEKNFIILARQTRYGSRVSDTFSTTAEMQTELRVRVTEGEDSDPKHVLILGESTMRIPPYPRGAPIEVFFEYNPDGMVKVTVFDLTGSKPLGEMVIERKANFTEGVVREKQQKLAKVTVN
jgi:molecular chaperone DnaK